MEPKCIKYFSVPETAQERLASPPPSCHLACTLLKGKDFLSAFNVAIVL